MTAPNTGAAIDYWSNGWRPVPLMPREKGRTYGPWGQYREQAPTRQEVVDMFDAHPESGVGLVMAEGVFRLDLDGRNAEALLKSRGVIIPEDAPRVLTGRSDGGCHVYLRSDVTLPQLAGDRPLLESDTGRTKTAVELRVNDIAPVPPTIHASGRAYQWNTEKYPRLSTPHAVPEAPPELLKLVAERAREIQQEQQARRGRNEGGPHWAAELLRGVGQGERDMQATRLCGYLFKKDLPATVVREIMLAMGERCDPAMLLRDIDKIVKSIGARHPDAGTVEEEAPGVIWHKDELVAHGQKRLQPSGNQWAAPTALPSLNSAFRGGFKGGRLYYLGGEPGMGKTALVIGCARHAAEQGLRVLFVSAEMPRESIYDRELAMEGEVNVGEVEDGVADPLVIQDSAERLSLLPIAIANEGVNSVHDIFKVAKDVQPQLLIVDYLQLISHGEKGSSPRERVESVSKGLKRLAIRLKCAVLCVSSLSRRQDKKEGEMPTNAMLRESGAIEFDADGIVLLGMRKGERKARVTKNRYGPLTEMGVVFRGEIMHFAEQVSEERGGDSSYESRADLFDPAEQEDPPPPDDF